MLKRLLGFCKPLLLVLGFALYPSDAKAQWRPQSVIVNDVEPVLAQTDLASLGVFAAHVLEAGSYSVRGEVLGRLGQDSEDDAFWDHVVIGAAAGLVFGFATGWSIDSNTSCVGLCEQQTYYSGRVYLGLFGLAVGGVTGAAAYWLSAPDDRSDGATSDN